MQSTQLINTVSKKLKKDPQNEAISIDADNFYDCSYCGEIFNSELIFNQHQVNNHSLLLNNSQKIQDLKTEDKSINVDSKLKSNLLDKVLSVVVKRILECSFCGEIFYSKVKLIDHEAGCQSLPLNSDLSSSSIKQIQSDTLHTKNSELKLLNENNNNIIVPTQVIKASTEFPVNLPDKLQKNIETNKLKNLPFSSSLSLSSVDAINISNSPSLPAETSFSSSINSNDNLTDRKKVYNLREKIKKPDRLSDKLLAVNVEDDNKNEEVDQSEGDNESDDYNESEDDNKIPSTTNYSSTLNCQNLNKQKTTDITILKKPEPVKFVRELICQFCKETFDCNNLRLRHIQDKHNMTFYSCQLCAYESQHHGKFKIHIQMHLSKNTKQNTTCDICHRDLDSPKSLIYHREVYHSVDTDKYMCEYEKCEYVSHLKKRVEQHFERHHKNIETLKCSVSDCTATFSRQKSLTSHLLYKHPETITKPIFHCNRCHKRFMSDSKYNKHLKFHDNQNIDMTNKKMFKCKLCPKEFTSDYFRKKHFFSTHKLVYYSCDQCDEKFGEKILLAQHIRKKHPKPKIKKTFECKECGKILKSKTLLIKHSSKHSNKFFECDYCGHKSKLKELLVRHIIRLHTEKYNFKCKEPGCSRKYKLFIDYQWHIKKHHS